MSDAAMQAYYAARAPFYDAVYDKPERRADIAFLKHYLAEQFARRRVLEIACGTGYWTQFIAPGARAVTALDLLAEPLSIARERSGVGAVQFVKADAFALSADLGSFDAAFAGLWLSHVPIARRREFLANLHGRLEAGARVVMIDNSQVQCLELPITERDEDGNSYQQRPLRDGSTHRVLKNFPGEQELLRMIEEFGHSPRYRMLDNFWMLEYLAGPKGMSFRRAEERDLAQMTAIRNSVKENVLSDPSRVTPQMYLEHLDLLGRGWVCEEQGRILGFSYAAKADASIWALFVLPDQEERGIGRELLRLAVQWLFSLGNAEVRLSTTVETRAERFYQRQGWIRGEATSPLEVAFRLRRPGPS